MAAAWYRDGITAGRPCVSSTLPSYHSADDVVDTTESSAPAFGARAVWVAAACILGVATALLVTQNGQAEEGFRLPTLRPGHRLTLRAAPSSHHQKAAPARRWEVQAPETTGALQESARRQQTLRTAIIAGALASAFQANADTPDFDLFRNLDTSAYDAATTRADVGKVKKSDGNPFGGFLKSKAADTKAPEAGLDAPSLADKVEDLFSDLLGGDKGAEPPKAIQPQAPVDENDPFAALRSAAKTEALPAPAPAAKAPAERPKPRERPPRPAPAPRPPAPPKVYGEPEVPKAPLLLAGGVGALAVGLLGFLLTRSTPNTRTQAKRALLQAIEGTDRGYRTPEDEAPAILSAIKALEKQNSVDSPLRSAFIDGKWELLYSTSDRVLAVSKGKATVETIDLDAGVYKLEAAPGFNLFAAFFAPPPTVLDVVDGRKARVMKADGRTTSAMKAVKKEKGSLRGSVRQASAAGATAVVAELTTTYLDDTWRVTRDAEGVSVFRRQGAVDDFVVEEDVERPKPSARGRAVVTPQKPMDPKPTRAPAPSFFARPKPASVEEEDDEEAPAPKPPSKPWFGLPKPATPKPVEEEEDDEEAPAPKPASKPWFSAPKSPEPKPVEEDDDEGEAPAPKPAPKPWFSAPKSPAPKRIAPLVEDDEDDDEEEAPAPKPAPKPKFGFPNFPAPKPRVQAKPEPEEDDDEEEDEEKAPAPKPAPKPRFDPPKPPAPKPRVQAKPEPEEEEDDEEEAAPEAPEPKPKPKPAPAFKFPSFGLSAPKKPVKEKEEAAEAGEKDGAALRAEAKATLLGLLPAVNQGASETPEQAEAILAAIQAAEALNPTPKPLDSPLLAGKWELLYTTSNTVVARDKPAAPKPKGSTFQYVDLSNLSLINVQAMGEGAKPMVFTGQLAVEGDNRLGVTFGKNVGWIDVTYLDEEVRITRGYQGNIFVLKMVDRNETRPPTN